MRERNIMFNCSEDDSNNEGGLEKSLLNNKRNESKKGKNHDSFRSNEI